MINPAQRHTVTALLLFSACCVAVSSAEEMTEIRYAGKLNQHKRGEDPTMVKEFSLLSIVEGQDNSINTLFWRVNDQAGWPWSESFGWSATDANQNQGVRDPGLLHDYDGQPWPIPLPPVYLPADHRASGKSWTVDRLKYEVQKDSKNFREQATTTVLVTTNFGRAQELRYDPKTGMLLHAQIKLFLGRGDEFSMTLEQSEQNSLSSTTQEKVIAGLGYLQEMQKQLDRGKRMVRPELGAEQIAVVTSLLPKLDKVTENTPLQPLTIDIHRDLKTQQERQSGVEKLAAQLIGQQAPVLNLKLLNGEIVDPETLNDKIIVLHFWKYQDDPLQEPYGQVGYLDYLNGKRGKLGVKFLGVAVNSEFSDPKGSRRIMLAVKKLVSFMNIGYDIVRDNGSLLKKFGDPRESGAKLPLWVVIGADGKIKHYKVGYYDVNPREGLKELDAAIIKEIKARRASEK
ncbi:redoxin domain-containing protein [Planctomycetaceae bacterium]|nr:redoxin domain-containing protein [Planctomycetaceae bacterium]MDC0307879.1 redoxin domain-containing protein [Planctomycetaceae bacterium]